MQNVDSVHFSQITIISESWSIFPFQTLRSFPNEMNFLFYFYKKIELVEVIHLLQYDCLIVHANCMWTSLQPVSPFHLLTFVR